jgi:hypothetical protein
VSPLPRDTDNAGGIINAQNLFHFFKYLVYALLSYNAFLFFQGDLAASAQTYGDTVTWGNFIEAYAATIDDAAWVLLLFLFELETAVIPDHLLKGWLNWIITGLSVIAYIFIVYAFYGYCAKYVVLTEREAFAINDVCRLLGTDFTYVRSLDDYLPIDQAACAAMQGRELMRMIGTSIIGTPQAFVEATRLAIVDIVNAADWLVIVALLEIEVYLQLRDRLNRRLMTTFKYIKGFLYTILLICAVYWGLKSTFLDFWDAFLWLVAFVFIELNVFQWNQETEQEKEHLMKV